MPERLTNKQVKSALSLLRKVWRTSICECVECERERDASEACKLFIHLHEGQISARLKKMRSRAKRAVGQFITAQLRLLPLAWNMRTLEIPADWEDIMRIGDLVADDNGDPCGVIFDIYKREKDGEDTVFVRAVPLDGVSPVVGRAH